MIHQDYTSLLQKLGTSKLDPEVLARLNELGKHSKDPLTGLLDYRSFSYQLQEAVEACSSGALVAISVDHLRELNIVSSWVVGDIALSNVGSLLADLPSADDFAGRVAGDTFMVFVHSTDNQGIRAWFRDLQTHTGALDLPGVDVFPEGKLTLSGGALVKKQDLGRADMLMHETKLRLAEAQLQGGNTLTFLAENLGATVEVGPRRDLRVSTRHKGGKDWVDVDLDELSMSGASYICGQPFLVRERVELRMVATEVEPLILPGEIVWRKPVASEGSSAFNTGVRFDSLSEELHENLENLMMGD